MYILGWDPGLKLTAWAFYEASQDTSPAWYLGGHSFEVGSTRPVLGRRARRRKDGTLREERRLEPSDMPPFRDNVERAFTSLDRIDLVVVEQPKEIVTEGHGFHAFLATAWLGGEIAMYASRVAKVPVLALSPGEWRVKLGLGRSPEDAEVKARLSLFASNLPRTWNNHVRDALGVGIAGRMIWSLPKA